MYYLYTMCTNNQISGVMWVSLNNIGPLERGLSWRCGQPLTRSAFLELVVISR